MLVPDENKFVLPFNRRPPRRMPRLFPDVTITDDPGTQYPLQYFDLVILVEPDEEEWKPIHDDPNTPQPWDLHCEMLLNELDPDSEVSPPDPTVVFAETTRILWLRNTMFAYYSEFAYDFADIAIRHSGEEEEFPEDLAWYLKAAYRHHPEWKVAVIGGMFEDEVTRLTNLLIQIGYDTTILTRYCLSVKGFQRSSRLLNRLFFSGSDDE